MTINHRIKSVTYDWSPYRNPIRIALHDDANGQKRAIRLSKDEALYLAKELLHFHSHTSLKESFARSGNRENAQITQ
jgi:hypothetical protein